MQQYSDTLTDLSGNSVRDATVRVSLDDGSIATVYDNNSRISGYNGILSTGRDGMFKFYADNGRYTLDFIISGKVYATKNIILNDPLDDKARSVYWDSFKRSNDVDDTDSLNRAIASGAERIRFRGSKKISGHVIFTNPIILSGDGRNSQITFTGTDAWFKIAGTSQAIRQGIEFEYLTFSANGFESVPHIFMDWARQIKLTKCFVYHCPISCNHMNFWNITDCELYDSDVTVRYTRNNGEANEVSGAPRVTASFFSNSLIDLEDCVDLMMVNSHMFQKGIRSRIINLKNEGTDPTQKPKSSYWIANSVFDSIDGLAWDFWDVALSTFMGNFISAGRTQGTDGASFYRCWHTKIIGNTFVYCGAYGMTLQSCEHLIVQGNDVIANPSGGVRTVGSCKSIMVTGNDFTTNPSVYGAPPTKQPVGFTDASSDGFGIYVNGNLFPLDDNSIKVYLPVTAANKNKVSNNLGVPDVLGFGYSGATADRPTNVEKPYQFFDTTLGIPIFYAGGSVWKNAAGVTV